MNTRHTQFSINRQPFLMKSVELHAALIQDTPDGRTVYLAQPVQLTALSQEQQCCEQAPMMTLQDGDTQGLMDELWRAGFRPTEGTGSAGSLAATQKHLEDMRTLVFKTLLPS